MYKFKCKLNQKHIQLPESSKEVKLFFHFNQINMLPQLPAESLPTYTISNLTIQDTTYSGCGDFVLRYKAVCSLTSNAFQKHPGPITTGGVGGLTSKSQHGIYKVNILLRNGNQVTMSGVCIDKITSTFPTYPLQG